jgi:hypothetical protein
MRNLFIGLLLGFLIAVPIAHTQQQPESIVVGVPVQIGMAKDVAISQIAEHGLTVTQLQGSEQWIVQQKNDQNQYDIVGALTFNNSRLSWASRTWVSNADPAAAKLARNFYFLVKSFEDHGNTSCVIDTQKQEGPDFDHDSLSVHCGRRTATLYVTKYKDQQPATSLDETIK